LTIKIQMPYKVLKNCGRVVEVIYKKQIISIADLFVDIIGERTFKQAVKGFFAFVDLNLVKHLDKEFEFGF